MRVCPCGRPKENRGPKSRQLVGAVGVIPIRRRYWQCPCGSDGAYAADDRLGMSGRFRRVVQRHACRLAADTSSAATSEHLKELLGVGVAAETVRTRVESHGKAMAKFQADDPATEKAFAQAEGSVEFAVDAGKGNTREEDWKDLKIAVISKRVAGEATTPERYDSQRLPAATMVLAFAMIAAAKTFRRSWCPRLKRLGVTAFATVHALGDAWIGKSVGLRLTGCTQTLDLYHACEHLARCAEAVFGEGTAETRPAFERGRGLLIRSGWAGVCAWVAELLAVEGEPEREQRRRSTEKLLKYFAAHVGRLNYAAMLDQGRAIGSGAVEGQAKTLGLRLKRRGAHWNRKHVQPMASLVCVRHSVQGKAYWCLAA